jgi:CBS-domain-containing membrane protein
MDVFKIMTRRVFTCRPEDDLATAAALMWDKDIGSVPVLDDQGRVCGMITDRDICMAAYTKGLPLSQIQVGVAMSQPVHSCAPDHSVVEAETVMRARCVRRMPVIDAGGRLVGILSLNDLVREAARQRGRKGRELGGDEVTATIAAVSQPRHAPEVVQVS